MIDPTLWRERAANHLVRSMRSAIDAGVTHDDMERLMRSAPSPFGAPLAEAERIWRETLDATFPSAKKWRPRKKGGA
jgi:hypothetical protein